MAIEEEEQMLKMNGFDDCIVGVVEQYGRGPILCYDKEKLLTRMTEGGMTIEEAIEFWEFNQIGAWMGDGTPCFITWELDGFIDFLPDEDDAT
jgi:hypothetical protein